MAARRLELQDRLAWNQTSHILSLIYSANRGKGGKSLGPRDFNPYAAADERSAPPPPPEPISILKDTFVDQRPAL